MKIRHLIVVAGSLIATTVLVGMVQVSYNGQRSKVLKFLPELVVADQNYTRDQMKRSQSSFLFSVALQDLVKGGYVSSADAKAFNGMDLKFYPTDGTKNPQATVVLVGMPDGTHWAAFANGSVGQLNSASFK